MEEFIFVKERSICTVGKFPLRIGLEYLQPLRVEVCDFHILNLNNESQCLY